MKENIASEIKICSKCIYDERVSYISFDENLKNDYGTATTKGEKQFIEI